MGAPPLSLWVTALAVVVATSIRAAAAAPPPASSSVSSWPADGAVVPDGFPALNALFNNSFAAVPPITVNASATLQLTLSEVYCGNLYVDDLRTAAASAPALNFSLHLVTASLECRGRWAYVLDGTRYEPGTFRADVSGVDFQLAAAAPPDPAAHQLPGNFTVSTCDFRSKIATSFKGAVLAWILDLLRPVADLALEEVLHKELCAAAAPAVAAALSNLTSAAARVLGPFLDDPTAPVVPRAPPSPGPAPGSVVNWAAVPLLSEALAAVNAMGPIALNGLVELATNFTGALDGLPLENLTLQSTTALANSTLELRELSVGGLDTLTAFDVLDPDKHRDNSTVDTVLGFGKLTIVVRAELRLWRGAGLVPDPPTAVGEAAAAGGGSPDGPRHEPALATQVLDLSFNLTNATLAVDLWAPLRTSAADDGLGALLLGHLTNTQCWLSKFDGLEVLLLAPTAQALEGPAVLQVLPFGNATAAAASSPRWDQQQQEEERRQPAPSALWSGLEELLEHVEESYYPALVSVLPLVANGPLATAINGLLNETLRNSAAACAADPLDPPGFVDWSDKTTGLGTFLWLLDIAFNGVLKAAGLDALLNKVLPGGRVTDPGQLLGEVVSRPDYGTARANLSNLTITGLTSFTDLVFPKAINASMLTLGAELGTSAATLSSSHDPLSLAFRTRLQYDPVATDGSGDHARVGGGVVGGTGSSTSSGGGDAEGVVNDFTTRLVFGELRLLANVTALVNRTRLARQPLGEMSFGNLSQLLNATTARLAIGDGLNLSSLSFDLAVDCAHCDTPALQALGPALEEPAAKAQLTKLFNVAAASLGPGVVASVNQQLENFLHYNNTPATADPWRPDFIVVNQWALSGLFLILLGLVVLSKCCCRHRRRSRSRSRSHPAADVEGQLGNAAAGHHHRKHHGQHHHHRHNSNTKGQHVHHPPRSIVSSVPFWAAFLFLLVLAIEYGDYVTANALCGTEIALRVLSFGDTDAVQLVSLYNFTLQNSVSEMWNGGVYVLATAIALFSGVWPYVKLLLMFFAWTAPTRLLPTAMRYRLLFVMDALGKWSLLDAFVLVLMMNVFKLPISLDSLVGFPLLEIDIVAVPRIGIYLFMVVTIGALVCNHVELNVHRHLQFPERYRLLHEAGQSTNTTISRRREALCSQSYRCRRSRGRFAPAAARKRRATTSLTSSEPLTEQLFSDESPSAGYTAWTSAVGGGGSAGSGDSPSSPRQRRQTLVCRAWVHYFVSFVIVLCVVGLLWGAFVDSFSFDMQGLASLVLGNASNTPYSLISVGNVSSLIKPEATCAQRAGYYFLQVCYYLFALGVPVLYLVVLLILWTVPMTLLKQHTMFVISETLAAWSAVDVFVLSIVVALLELPSYVSFIVGDKCDAIDPITKQFPWVVPDGDLHCFDVKTKLLSGCWILGLATLAYLTVSYSLTRVCDRAIEERSRMYHKLLTASPRSPGTGGSDGSGSSSSSSDAEEEEDLDDTDRPFVNCDGKCGACLFKCFRVACFRPQRRTARY